MERKIGETFDFFGKKLKCVESKNKHCSNCWFLDSPYCYMYTYISLIGKYQKKNRSDKNNVYFELINK